MYCEIQHVDFDIPSNYAQSRSPTHAPDSGTALLQVLDPPDGDMCGEVDDLAQGSPARVVWRDRRPLVTSASNDAESFPKYVEWMKEVGLQAEWAMPISSVCEERSDDCCAMLMSEPSGSADIGGKTVHPAQGVMTLTVIYWPLMITIQRACDEFRRQSDEHST